MKTRSFVIPLFTLSLCAACASMPAAPTKTADPVPAPTSTSSTPTPAEAVPAEVPKAAETPAPAAPAAVKASTFHIEGVSISDVTIAQMVDALKKRGWDSQPYTETLVGKYQQVSVSGRKDKTNKVIVTVTISRTAKEPKPITDATNESDFAPKSLQARYSSTDGVAQTYDSAADVLVSVMYQKGGKTADAQKLLDALVTPAK